jgi:hypothetical protein
LGVEHTREATGLAGVLGNKGGLAVKLKVARTTFCFVSCHLAAHQVHDIFKMESMPTSRIIFMCWGRRKNIWITAIAMWLKF